MPMPIELERLPYEMVAASQTAQVLGTTGAVGDYLSHILIVPAVAACGTVAVIDGSTTIFTFAGGGTTALPTLAPIAMPIAAKSVNGPWKITTTTNVAVMAVGNFT